MDDKPNTIILFDGNHIVGYPKSEVSEPIDNSMQIDTTGQYLSVGKPKPFPKTPEEVKAQQELFFQNAFLFLYHREVILSDSRLFLTPLPFQSGLAYIGEGGFKHPTLGIYIEWWKNCPASIVDCANGKTALLYRVAGSPLSGCNSCGLVDAEGNSWGEQISTFNSAFSFLMKLNRRYDYAKERYEAYTLAEAVEIIQAQPAKPIPFDYDIEMIMMHREILHLKKLHEKDMQYAINQDRKITQLLVAANRDALTTLYSEYIEDYKKAKEDVAEAYEQRVRLRKLLKEGMIDNKEHQNRLRPINKIIRERLMHVEDDYYMRIRNISPDLNSRKLCEYFAEHPVQKD